MKNRVITLIALSIAALCLGACVSNKPKPYKGERVNNLPHSTPEPWQGSGQFGSMFPQTQ